MKTTSQPTIHINLDHQEEAVKLFFRTIPIGSHGSVLDMDGEAILRLLPVTSDDTIDKNQLRKAIVNRREASRQLNADWSAVDHETWQLNSKV